MGGRGASSSIGRGGNKALKNYQKMNVDDLYNLTLNLKSINRDDLYKQGLNGDNPVQRLVDKLNLHDKPVVLDDDAFDKMVKDNNMIEIYRGVWGNGKANADDVRNQTMYGDKTYIGDGIHGDGIYFSTAQYTAKSYGPTRMTAVINPNKAKIITESKLQSMYYNDPVVKKYQNDYMDTPFRNISQYALYKGYNVIQAVGGNGSSNFNAYNKKTGLGEDFYIPLDRSTLIFRKNSKI